MILSTTLTSGQLTFVTRVAVQILSYGGSALIGLIILGSVPRLAPVDTHDTVNRIVGASTANRSTVKWIVDHIQRNAVDPTPPIKLLFILTLSITYTLFASLSDVGLLGFHTCSVSGPSLLDYPASLTSNEAAWSFITAANIVNTSDPTRISAWRCDSSLPSPAEGYLYNCTSWHNSTYADPTLFAGINSTDSDVLLSRQLSRSLATAYDTNSFYLGPDAQRLLSPTISNGLAINPHPTGVQIIAGVPQLSPNKAVTIPQTMAIEVEVGCMTLGLTTIKQVEETSAYDYMSINGNWSKYVGPDYLHDVLFQSATETRAYLRPLFDESTLSSGSLRSFNDSTLNLFLARSAKVSQFSLPIRDDLLDQPDPSPLANCTMILQRKLGLTPSVALEYISREEVPQMCGYYGIGASTIADGSIWLAFEGMICASTTQVNMVSSTITVSPTNTINITSPSRLPSTLNYLRADFFNYVVPTSGDFGGGNVTIVFPPYERYTLTPSPNGPTSHLVYPSPSHLADSHDGPGSGGTFITSLNSILFDSELTLGSMKYTGLLPLPSGFEPLFNVSPAMVTEWISQVAGSIASASITYNAWAACQVPPLLVTSTGGSLGTCYNPLYALGFLPLILVTLVVLIWTLILLFQQSLFGSKQVEMVYGGLAAHTYPASSQALPKDTLLIWEQGEHPQLQVVEKGYPITGHPSDTVQQFLKAH